MPTDVHQLVHPLVGSIDEIHYHYMASQALIEMSAAKCDLRNLLRLSVGRKMESYLDTYCGLPDLTGEFKNWINRRQKCTYGPCSHKGHKV